MKTPVRFEALGALGLPSRRFVKKALKRVVPLAVGIYFIPYVLAAYFVLGLIDIMQLQPSEINPWPRSCR